MLGDLENGISVDLVGGEPKVLPTHLIPKVSCDWAQTDHTDKNICERQETHISTKQTRKDTWETIYKNRVAT